MGEPGGEAEHPGRRAWGGCVGIQEEAEEAGVGLPGCGSSAGDTDYSPVFLSPTGIHSSKHWEATREGIQDYQYLAMLRNVVRIMERDGTTPDLQREAALMLSTTPTATIKSLQKNGDRVDMDNSRNPSVFTDQARLRVLRMLVKIYNAYSSTADQ